MRDWESYYRAGITYATLNLGYGQADAEGFAVQYADQAITRPGTAPARFALTLGA